MATTDSFAVAIRRNRMYDGLFYALTYGFFLFFSLLVLYPFYYIVVNSFNAQLMYGPVMYWPSELTMSNYVMVMSDATIVRSLLVSVLRVAVGSTAVVAVNSMCAFALRKRTLRFRNFYLVFFVIPMFFQGGLIPVYLNLRMLGLLDTFAVYILPPLFSFFYVIILMSSFNDIPESVEDSALIDGAGFFTIYRRIYLPMSVPVIVTIFLFSGVQHWETWFDSLYFTRDERLQTFAAFLMRVVRRFSNLQVDTYEIDEDSLINMANAQGTRFAAMVISIVPVLMVYPFIQKYFVQGIKLGAIKG